MVKPLMMHCRASHTVDMACNVQNLPRALCPSGRKTAHRGLAARHRGASGKTRVQAMMPSGKNPRRATTARQSPLLPQTTPFTCGQYYRAASNAQTKSGVSGADVVAMASTLNDAAGSTATFLDDVGLTATQTASKVARGAPIVGLGLSSGILLHGYSTGNRDQMFDGGYGMLAFLGGAIEPGIGIGMFLAKLSSDLSPPQNANILDLAANYTPPTNTCPRQSN